MYYNSVDLDLDHDGPHLILRLGYTSCTEFLSLQRLESETVLESKAFFSFFMVDKPAASSLEFL